MTAGPSVSCPAVYSPTDAAPVSCEREQAGHIGDHHGHETVTRTDASTWLQLWVWSDAGSAHGFNAAHTAAATPCNRCGTPHDRNPAMRAANADLDTCFHCALWDRRAVEYATPGSTLFRPHGDHGPFDGQPYLYSWATKDPRRPTAGTGAFGDRRYTVVTDDGRTLGPDSRLWSGGQVPWWRVDEFPPNCTIEQTPRIAPRLDLAGTAR